MASESKMRRWRRSSLYQIAQDMRTLIHQTQSRAKKKGTTGKYAAVPVRLLDAWASELVDQSAEREGMEAPSQRRARKAIASGDE